MQLALFRIRPGRMGEFVFAGQLFGDGGEISIFNLSIFNNASLLRRFLRYRRRSWVRIKSIQKIPKALIERFTIESLLGNFG